MKTLCPSDSHQSNAYGGYGGPGTSRHHGDKYANEAGRGQEKTRLYDFHAVVYQRGHNTTNHPDAA